MKIVISGGPFSGKTTIIELLKQKGYNTIVESGSEVIEIINELIGVDSQMQWRKKYKTAYQELVWERLLKNEDDSGYSNSDVIFCDRGLFDGVAFSEISKSKIPTGYEQYLNKDRYFAAFILETLEDFKPREDEGKYANYETSRKIGKKIYEVYKKIGIFAFFIPEMNIHDRLSLIISQTNEIIRIRKKDHHLRW